MAATHTLTGNFHDLLGDAFDASSIRAYVEPSQTFIVDTDPGGGGRFGRKQVTIETDGSWSVDGLPDTEDPGWNPTGFGLRLVIEVRDGAQGASTRAKQTTTNWFALTADTDFKDVAEIELEAVSTELRDTIHQWSLDAQAAAEAAEAVGTTNDAVIAGRINDPASATASALSASIDEIVDPVAADVASHQAVIDDLPTDYVQNTSLAAEQIRTSDATARRPWLAALADAQLGVAPARFMFYGDSREEGYGATGALTNRMQERIAAIMRAQTPIDGGAPAYSPNNYYPVKYVSSTLTSLWSAPSGGTTTTPNNFGLGARVVTLGVGASTTLTFTGTSIKIAYVRVTGAQFSYAIDGGSATNSPTGSGPLDGQTITISGLGGTSHTLTITGVAGTSYIAGAYVYNGEESEGIQFFDASHHGITSGSTGQSLSGLTTNTAVVNPHAVLINIGTNDHGGNVAPATYKTNMTALIGAIASGCTVTPTFFLMAEAGRSSGFTYPWSAYVDVMRELVADDPAHRTLIDMSLRMPALSDNSLSVYYDTLHENNKGQAMKAAVLARLLLPS